MKGINRFFYRLDLIKKVVLVISVPAVIACWFFPVGMIALLTVGPLAHIGLVLGLFPMHMPADTEIAKETQECHKAYLSQVARECKLPEEAVMTLEGFSDEAAFLRRRTGSRVFYPICRTVAFTEADEILSLHIKDTPLMQGKTGGEIKWQIVKTQPVSATLEKQKSKVFVLTLSSGTEQLAICIQDKYKTVELLEKYRRYIAFDKDAVKSL